VSARKEPLRVRKIDSAQSIKALADPLRLRVLSLLMRDHDRTWTVKEIAAELEQSVTKLYHHVNTLEQAGLIRDVETRLVSGIVEHRYASGQRGLEFDDALYRSADTRDASLANVSYMLDEARDDLVGYLRDETSDPERAMVSKAKLRLTEEEAAELRTAMQELIDRYQSKRSQQRRTATPRTDVLVVVHPASES
jgi:DNA-binding transcriptional ArsR family regulator